MCDGRPLTGGNDMIVVDTGRQPVECPITSQAVFAGHINISPFPHCSASHPFSISPSSTVLSLFSLFYPSLPADGRHGHVIHVMRQSYI
jgi:hypothetical protein